MVQNWPLSEAMTALRGMVVLCVMNVALWCFE
jgi:hypothetical protein